MGAAERDGLDASDSHGADQDVDIDRRHDEHISDVNVVDIDDSRPRRPLFVHWRLPATGANGGALLLGWGAGGCVRWGLLASATRAWRRLGMYMTVTSSIKGGGGHGRRVVTALVVTLGMVSFLVMGATAAVASCAGKPTIDENLARAELVFVGTTVEVTNSSRWATFAVEDIWKGRVDGNRVEIRGGAREAMGTSMDRKYLVDTRYLVFALAPPTGPPRLDLYGEEVRWTDNACSLTQPYTPSLRDARPATARAVEAPPQEPPMERSPVATPHLAGPPGARGPSGPDWPFALAVVAVGGAVAVGIRIRRRQRVSARR